MVNTDKNLGGGSELIIGIMFGAGLGYLIDRWKIMMKKEYICDLIIFGIASLELLK